MIHDASADVEFLVIIAGRKQKEELVHAITQAGARLVNVMYGKGSVSASYLRDVFGFVPEENKVVIICLAASHKTDSILEMLIDSFDFNSPNSGIAFATSIDKLSM